MDVREIALAARDASRVLAGAGTEAKNTALRAMAGKMDAGRADLLAANEADLKQAKERGLPANLVKRLRFGESKIDSRIRCLHKIAALTDPVGQTIRSDLRPNGLQATRVRVPLGVILMIYEARPHVTVNAGAFCLKSGNAAILRGGSEARRCNDLMSKLWRDALGEAGLPEKAVQIVSGSHDEIREMLQLEDLIDLVIPRGGKGLIKAVFENSKIPVIKHYQGICHVYVDSHADTTKALRIILDSKLLMPEVCNALETVLIDEAAAGWLPELAAALNERGVELRGCSRTRDIVPEIAPAEEEDWRTEYLDTILSIRVVDGVDAAVRHIARFGSGHTDVIVTESYSHAHQFVRQVDSSVVLVNGSTMFCDGETLGMGAEIGISTDKLHARGPMGLEELTSYKYVIWGTGQIMGALEDWRPAGQDNGKKST